MWRGTLIQRPDLLCSLIHFCNSCVLATDLGLWYQTFITIISALIHYNLFVKLMFTYLENPNYKSDVYSHSWKHGDQRPKVRITPELSSERCPSPMQRCRLMTELPVALLYILKLTKLSFIASFWKRYFKNREACLMSCRFWRGMTCLRSKVLVQLGS